VLRGGHDRSGAQGGGGALQASRSFLGRELERAEGVVVVEEWWLLVLVLMLMLVLVLVLVLVLRWRGRKVV